MSISPINYQCKPNNTLAFKANLWVDKSVQQVIKSNRENFMSATKMFDGWLKTEQGHVLKTLNIRKNTSLVPNVALEREESRISYAYPHEDSGYTIRERIKKYEDLEFELGDRKCGFWFDPDSNVEKLLSDFKNMFNHLHKS